MTRRCGPRRLSALVLLTASSMATCTKGQSPLGLPDSHMLFAPATDSAGAARTCGAGLPLVAAVPIDDPRATTLHRLFTVGFAGEVLRTDYLVKQFVREVEWAGRSFDAQARRDADQPTIFLVGAAPPPAGRGLCVEGMWGGGTERPDLPWIGISDRQLRDEALTQTLAGALGRRIANTLVGGAPAATAPAPTAQVLVDGYAQALEVIAREWRVGEGPRGALAPDAGTAAQRDLFAGVRQNRYARTADGKNVRPVGEMLADPGLVATLLYRFAQSKGIGHRVAPAALYAPFVAHRIPEGVSPAAVLGPFRNFQAKLLAVWGRAILSGGGKAPRDIVDLVEAYVGELPAERGEVIRQFVITTWGATVKAGGVTVGGAGGATELPELTALAAEVTAGRRSLRHALLSSGNP